MLVVDDEASIPDLIRRMLRRAGDCVYPAHSVAEAWTELAGHEDGIDRALIDLKLPDGDGLTLAVEVHAAYPDIHILLMSGGDSPLATEFDMLQKPFTMNELHAAIA